jgi:hypothetical protein
MSLFATLPKIMISFFPNGKERKEEGKLPNKYQFSSSSSFSSYEVEEGKFLVMLRSKSPLFVVNVGFSGLICRTGWPTRPQLNKGE